MKFIVFDLDGTLINTLPGIYNASAEFLKLNNYEYTYTQDEIRSFIGKGARILFKKITKKDTIDEIQYKEFLDIYLKEQKNSLPYENVYEILKNLAESGYLLLIYSNKPDELLQNIVSSFFKDIDFLVVKGANNDFPLKPDPTYLRYIINRFNLGENGYYVGDSEVDVELGKNANLKTIILKYGYGDFSKIIHLKPNYVIERFDEILEVVKND